ncbi:N-6 DNA methylase [Lactobacillus sp. LC28-10]|uniref:N-6 DNA methylase n=1 Tax=Secundilactobacillus angelensis TaxID=2722706 RepID=A0ABX1KWL4_9LACO|nr:N-6 DNA methylase [Secundilactobacillus angelensis]MCH5462507.1 N-6 DNA methylase [Secundilactobacillus angelensis]NLR18302.1 N-6 DNA methylase [Secundilactobacillus angelensis]
MHENDLIALIAEGGAEEAILEVLLDYDLLKFKKTQLLNEEVLRTRSASQFQKRYLDHDFGPNQQVYIYRILDSRRETFKLSKAYQYKVSGVTNLYTTPEIEMLFVVYFDKFKEFQKSKLKPSQFIRQFYQKQIGNIKSKDVVYDFWSRNPEDLVSTIKKYVRLTSNPKEFSLMALLKDEYK